MENKKKEIKDVRCKGRIPGTSIKCEEILYQSDGEFLIVGGLVVNPDLDRQKILYDNCGYVMNWKRNREFY